MAGEGVLRRLLSPGFRGNHRCHWGRRLLSSSNCDVLLPERAHRVKEEAEESLGTSKSSHSPPAKEPKDGVCLPTVFLPEKLQAALDNLLSGYPIKQLTSDGMALVKYLENRRPPSTLDQKMRRKGHMKVVPSNPWNGHTHSNTNVIQAPLRYGRREGLACAASRLQAWYGTCLRVFNEVAKLRPQFQPKMMLDFGSGLGTAVWAAHKVWGDSLYEYQAIDSSQEMGELALALRTGGELATSSAYELPPPHLINETIPGVHFKQFLPVSNKVRYDLVVTAHSLSELSTAGIRRSSLAALWRKTQGILVVIELGNRAGYSIINEARDLLLSASSNWPMPASMSEEMGRTEQLDGHVLAPCPHDGVCPLADSQWICHFAQRVQLSTAQRHTAFRHQGYHIEPFSYLVMKKGLRTEVEEEVPPHPRLLRPVKKRNRHVICHLCCPNGGARQLILTKSKTDKELYRQARKKDWGDTLAVSPELYEDRITTTTTQQPSEDHEHKTEVLIDLHVVPD